MPEETAQATETPVQDAPVEETKGQETEAVEETPAPEPVADDEIIEEEPVVNQVGTLPFEEEEPEPDEPAPVAEAQFSNEQFALAAALGMSVEEVKSFGDPAMFDRVIGGLANRAVRAKQQQQQQAATEAGAKEQQASLAGDFAFEDPDDYDDGVIGFNENTNKRFQQMEAQMNALVQQNQSLMQQHNVVQQEVASRELDSIFNAMDEKIFGRGRLNEVPEEVGQNRIQVANEAARLGQVHIQGGEQAPSLAQLAQRAANSLFGEKFTQNALEKASDRSRKISGQSSAVPTRQEDTSDRGYEAAVRAAADWQREHGNSDDYQDAFPS